MLRRDFLKLISAFGLTPFIKVEEKETDDIYINDIHLLVTDGFICYGYDVPVDITRGALITYERVPTTFELGFNFKENHKLPKAFSSPTTLKYFNFDMQVEIADQQITPTSLEMCGLCLSVIASS